MITLSKVIEAAKKYSKEIQYLLDGEVTAVFEAHVSFLWNNVFVTLWGTMRIVCLSRKLRLKILLLPFSSCFAVRKSVKSIAIS